jgi:hypothetical protein
MPEDNQTTGIGGGGTATVAAPVTDGAANSGAQAKAGAQGKGSNGGVVMDKNKSNEEYIKEAENNYIVPDLIRTKFPDLIKLIFETESMNEEEREYWLQIMPIMSEEQIMKFRDILVNEKDQLSKLDQEYEKEMARINDSKPKEIDEAKMKEEMQKIQAAESESEVGEAAEEAALLKELEDL